MGRTRVGVLGAGAWGTALAHTLASNGHEVTVWAYEADVAEEIQSAARNSCGSCAWPARHEPDRHGA
jgi:glycerol-3-phosphate dehydrogenase (NAD(P)+)